MSRFASAVMSNRGTWRGLITGTNPKYDGDDHLWADGATDEPGTPDEPIETNGWLQGGAGLGLPWWDALEDPTAAHGIETSPDPPPWVYHEDAGGEPIVGAYEGAYRSQGPVVAFGQEPSGGLSGDQALGRIMRFPANKPERFDSEGVVTGDWSSELASAIANNGMGVVTESEYTTELLTFPNIGG